MPTKTKWGTWVKLGLVVWFSALFFILSCLTYRESQDNQHLPELERSGSSRLLDRPKETNCGGLCPCTVRPEVPPGDLEHWEVGGKEIFKDCPAWLRFPRDLGPRQWTWRVAEVNLWIQVVLSLISVYQTWRMPRALLKELQLAFAVLMLLASVSAAYWVHLRAVVPMLQYFFCALVTRALYMAAKYAVLAGVVSACAMTQISFRGCEQAALRSVLIAECLPVNNCTQTLLEQNGCWAPGADTCDSLGDFMPSARHGKEIFADDVLELLFFLCGTVPIFMAATARESRKESGSEAALGLAPPSKMTSAPAVPSTAQPPIAEEMLPGR